MVKKCNWCGNNRLRLYTFNLISCLEERCVCGSFYIYSQISLKLISQFVVLKDIYNNYKYIAITYLPEKANILIKEESPNIYLSINISLNKSIDNIFEAKNLIDKCMKLKSIS